jgi:AcrR family transcriptional regulator
MKENTEISSDWMRISELAKKAGLSRNTIHYYFREGLLPPPLKTGRTMAFYTNSHLDCLGVIRKLREERNLPIAAIRLEIRRLFGKHCKPSSQKSKALQADPTAPIKGKEQRRKIIESAVMLFSSEGFSSTHVSHITDILHISKGTFYLYFKNKNDLLIAVLGHLVDEIEEVTVKDEPDVFARLVRRGETYVAFYKKYHKIFDIIRAESIGSNIGPELSVQAIFQKIMDPVTRDIRQGQAEGVFPKTFLDPELMGYMIMGALDFLCFRLLMDGTKSDEEIVDILKGFHPFRSLLAQTREDI